MARPAKVALWVGGVLAALVVVVVVAVFIAARTPWAHERVVRVVVSQIEEMGEGQVRIGRLEGNLLGRIRMLDVEIVDAEGRPFLAADTLEAGYSVLPLRRQRIEITDLRLAGARVVLDQPPGEKWNFSRIFAIEPDEPDPDPGWGSWVSLEDVRLADVRVEIRTEWTPDPGEDPDEVRERIEAVPGGLQSVREFRGLEGHLPTVLIADPDVQGMRFEVASFEGTVALFEPPHLEVKGFTGSFQLPGDGIVLEDVRAVLPGSDLTVGGVIDFDSDGMAIEARGSPVAFADFRWLYPPLFEEGGGDISVDFTRRDGVLALAADVDLQVRESRVEGRAAATIDEMVRVDGADLRLSALDTRLIEAVVPDLELPHHGELSGRVRLAGPAASLDAVADLTFTDRISGTSRVVAEGKIGFDEVLRFDDFQVRFDPLRTELVRAFDPGTPLVGPLRGTARLDGSPATRLVAQLDLAHDPPTGLTRIFGDAEYRGDARWVRADVRLMPLSLATVGLFVPAAELRGTASGRILAEGDPGDLSVEADLEFPEGGTLRALAVMDLDAPEPGYVLESRLGLRDLAAVSARAPGATSLTGRLDVRGRGFDPATMVAEVEADLEAARVDELEVDSVTVRLAIAEGRVRADPVHVRVGESHASVRGDFGLVGERRGQLEYEIALDPLEDLERYLPQDTLSGRLLLAGRLEGSVERFDLTGEADAEGLRIGEAFVSRGRTTFEARGVRTPELEVDFEGTADSVRFAVFEFVYMSAEGTLQGEDPRTGRLALVAHPEEGVEYTADAEVSLALERNEVRLHDLGLRFDTVQWAAVRPATLAWNGDVLEITDFELRSDVGGRLLAEGRLPAEGEGELDLEIEQLELGHLSLLLQQETHATGRIDLVARVEGTLRAPVMDARVAWIDARIDDQELPEIRAELSYRDAELTADAEFFRLGRLLAVAEGRLPLDLALADQEGPRLREEPFEVEIRADNLPLDALPAFTDLVRDVDGVASGRVTARGTFDAPELDGELAFMLPSLTMVASGVRYRGVTGALRLEDRLITVDSIVAWREGPIRLEGTVAVTDFAAPTFDLRVGARRARVLDNEYGRLRVDADLEIQGPFDAVRITGDVTTRSGVIRIPEDQRTLLVDIDDPDMVRDVDPELAAALAEVVELSPLLQGLDVEVELRISPDTWVRTADANVEIYTPEEVGPVIVRRDPATGDFWLDGTVITDRGQYAFMGRRFELTRGTATFLPGPELDPLIQLAADHEVPVRGRENLRIRILIEGTAFEPTISLESSAQPPIPETDLISYLAFGRSASGLMQPRVTGMGGDGAGGGLVGNVAGIATQQLAAVAAHTLLDELEAEAGRALGLDVLQISPAEVPPEIFRGRNWDDLRRATEIEAGTYIGGRLFAAGHARPTTEALPGLRMEYRHPDGYRVTTSWEPQFLPPIPTLQAEQDPERIRVFGAFLRREWRF